MTAFELFRGDALDAYPGWPAPVTIVSDGAYGVRGFHGDTVGADGLPDWYRPHIARWSAAAGPASREIRYGRSTIARTGAIIVICFLAGPPRASPGSASSAAGHCGPA